MDTRTAPRVTVFMAVHDRATLLRAAIASVLAQTFADFELLVVDDGSTDGSPEAVASFDDRRIRLVRQPRNRGIPETRNHGLALARGEYLAILDSDDVAFARRLEHQVAFLDARPEIAAVGSWARRVHPDGRAASPALRPVEPREIRARMPFATCFKNPTMMGRTEAMREFGYRNEFAICQDIDLWARMSAKHALANLPEFLIRYRLGGTSHESPILAARMKKRIAADLLRDLGVHFDAYDLDRHHRLRNPRGFSPDAAFVDWCEDWLGRLIDANAGLRVYPEPEFSEAAAERWWRLAGTAVRHGTSPLRFLRSHRFRRSGRAAALRLARLAAHAASAQLSGIKPR